MKFIDEKGRLFERINIIDLLIVLLIIVGLFAVNYKLGLIKKMNSIEQEPQKHIIKIWVKDIALYTVDAISVGDPVYELRSNVNFGEIIEKKYEPFKDRAIDSNGTWKVTEVPERFDAYLDVETKLPEVNGNIKLGSIDAKVGASITIKGPKFQVNAYIVGVE